MCEHKSCRDCQTAENGIKADYKVIVAKPFKWFVPASDKDGTCGEGQCMLRCSIAAAQGGGLGPSGFLGRGGLSV